MKEFLHHLVVPRESNNHRSRLLHYEIMFLVISVLVSGLITMVGIHREYPAVLGISTNISVKDLLQDTNKKRQENGLAPLALNEKLNDAAAHKAKNMFAQNYWAHVAPDGTTPWVFIKDSDYQYLYAGENLARGFTTADEVVDAWMKSPSHRENLLSPNYTDIGFAVDSGELTGSETVLVVQMFGSPYGSKEELEAKVLNQPVPSSSGNIETAPTSMPPVVVASQDTDAGVAAIQSNPLVDMGSLKKNAFFFFISIFIVVLLIDAIIIERKQIARVFSHNIDHILFLLFVLLAGILIGRGMIV